MSGQAVDQLKDLLGEEHSGFLDFLQESTRQSLAEAVSAHLAADTQQLENELKTGLSKLPPWLRAMARKTLGSDD